MKHTIILVKQKAVLWTVGITLALIPLSAFAAYMKEPGKPIITQLDGTDTITGEYRIVGTMEKPQTKLDNMLTDIKQTLVITPKKETPITAEEMEIRKVKGQILAKQMMVAQAQGETINFWWHIKNSMFN